ncbi:MAG: hypothetical protein MI924_05300 [Chloroflexales bacterium]|nr:hypothetical protein [Chloroflexales bacterium]
MHKKLVSALFLLVFVTSCGVPSAQPSVPPALPPTQTTPNSSAMPPEQLLAWRQVQVILPPETPILAPTWLPASLQGRQPEALSDIRNDPISGPMYAVTYNVDSHNNLTFGVGPIVAPPSEAGPGAPLPIRGTTATLTTREGAMWLHWEEQGRTYAIEATGAFVSQDDLQHIAAPSGAPAQRQMVRLLRDDHVVGGKRVRQLRRVGLDP